MNQNMRFVLLSLLLIISCKDEKNIDCNLFHWSYEGDSDPDHWSACEADCGGQSQSPVNIADAISDVTLPLLPFLYEAVPIHLTNNGHTIEFEYEAGSSLSFGGLVYELIQFHFHAASEHTLAGQEFPLEIHLVHKHSATGNLLVIGVLFEDGNENPFLQHFINDLPDETDEHFTSALTVTVEDLFPAARQYYTYNGSLTTPPCSEIVTWIVMKNTIELSGSQLQHFTDILHNNNRPVQSLNGRVIKVSS